MCQSVAMCTSRLVAQSLTVCYVAEAAFCAMAMGHVEPCVIPHDLDFFPPNPAVRTMHAVPNIASTVFATHRPAWVGPPVEMVKKCYEHYMKANAGDRMHLITFWWNRRPGLAHEVRLMINREEYLARNRNRAFDRRTRIAAARRDAAAAAAAAAAADGGAGGGGDDGGEALDAVMDDHDEAVPPLVPPGLAGPVIEDDHYDCREVSDAESIVSTVGWSPSFADDSDPSGHVVVMAPESDAGASSSGSSASTPSKLWSPAASPASSSGSSACRHWKLLSPGGASSSDSTTAPMPSPSGAPTVHGSWIHALKRRRLCRNM